MSLRRSATALFALLAGTAGASLLALVTQWVLTQSLDLASYGKFAALLAAINLGTPIASIGINWFWLQAFGREGDRGFRWVPASLHLFAMAYLISVALVAAYVVASGGAGTPLSLLIGGAAVILAGQALVELGSAKLQLEERYYSLSWWQTATPLGRCLLASLLALGGLASLSTIVTAFAAIGLLIALVGIRQLAQLRSGKVALKGHAPSDGPAAAATGLKETFHQSYPFALITIFYLIYFQSVVLLIELLLDPAQAGLFNAALILMAAINLLPNVIFQKFLLPKQCRWAESAPSVLNLVTNIAAVALGVIGLVVAVTVILAADTIIALLFGSKFQSVGPVLAGLALAVPIRFVQSAYSSVYINAQQMRAKVRFAGLSALVSVALNLALLPTLGLMGAVIASVMSESLLLLLTVFGLRRHVPAVTPGLALRPMAIRRQIGLELARGTDRSDLPAQ